MERGREGGSEEGREGWRKEGQRKMEEKMNMHLVVTYSKRL